MPEGVAGLPSARNPWNCNPLYNSVNLQKRCLTLDLSDEEVEAIRQAGLLHDVGMIAVPDGVVNKPGRLSESELEVIRNHCRKGQEILEPMAHLRSVGRYVLEHHERLDGTGYPDGKGGDQISLGGQIVAVAETWTALTEERSYRPSTPKAEAMEAIREASGQWFSGPLVQALRAAVSQ